MGQLDVHIRHGGGGPDLPGLVPLAVIAVACTAAAAAIAEALIVVAAVICAVAVAVAAVWFGTRKKRAARRAEVTAQWAANRQAIEDEDRQRKLESRRFQLELAAKSTPVINNIIVSDPAAPLAVLDSKRQPWPQPVRQAIRSEVEK